MQPVRLIALLTFAATVFHSNPTSAQTGKHASTTTSKIAKIAPAPDWKTAVEARRKQLIDQNGPGTDALLRNQLLTMRNTDQTARGFVSAPAASSTKEMVQKLPATDAQLTQELKQIVKEKGWPTIALAGIDASNAAMLILTHSPDHAWQLQLLPQLEQLADSGKIDPSNLALVVDKELVSEGKLQRYGSQFKLVNGAMAMYGVEDPGGLDQLRARALLSPINVYKEQLTQIYHLPTSNAIISAAPQPQQ